MNAPPSRPILASVDTLAKSRRRHTRAIAFYGTLAALVALAGMLALVDTRAEWLPSTRIVLAALLAGAFLVALLRRLAAARRHDLPEAARTIEAAHPEMGQKLRTALDVARGRPPADPAAAAFHHHLMEDVSRDLAGKPWKRLVPRKRLWQHLAAAVAVVSLVALAAWKSDDYRLALKRLASPHRLLSYTSIHWNALPKSFDENHPPRIEFTVGGRLAQPEFKVRHGREPWKTVALTRRPDGRTWDIVLPVKTADIQVSVTAGDSPEIKRTLVYRPLPKLVDSSATIKYPAYIGLADEKSPGGDVRAVEDSVATWLFTFNTPPARVEWKAAGAAPAILAAIPGTAGYQVSATVRTGKSQAELAIYDEAGERIDSWQFEVDGVADKLPQVEIVEPSKDLELISTAEMPIRIRAKDDFGVAEIGLIMDASGKRQWILETVIDETNQRQVSDLVNLMLEQHRLTITDNVRIHAYALDHKPRGGPRAVSKLVSIDIVQFQKRLVNGLKDGQEDPEGGADPEAVTDALKKLDKLIEGQRGILSDVFGTKESFRSQLNAEVRTQAAKYTDREVALGQEAYQVGQEWLASAQIPKDDVALMGAAAEQMIEAAGRLAIPDLVTGFVSGDRALSTLLQLRKELITIIMKSKGKKPSDMKDPPPPLADLAKEARRLAAEEKDVGTQITPEAIAGNSLKATRRQQEVALADTGELFAKMVDHPERTEGSLLLMDDAEKAVERADKALNGAEPRDAAPELAAAERQLLDVAVFLEAMDLERLSDTLRKLAENSEKSAEEQKSQAEKAGRKPPGEDQTAGKDAGKSAPKEGGKTSPKEGDAAAEAAKKAELAKKILDELAKKAAPEPGSGDEAPKSPSAAALAALAKTTDPAGLAKDLEKLADMQKEGDKGNSGETAKLRDEVARQLGEMAREYREAAASLDASRLAELNKAREQAEALKKELAKNEPKPGDGSKPGDKPGDKPGGQAKAGDKGEKPGAGGKEGQGGKDGQGGKGEKPEKGDMADAGEPKEGGKPGSQSGGNAPGGGHELATGRFARSLDQLDDPEVLGKLSNSLYTAPFDRGAIPLVEAADARLQELIDRIPIDSSIAASRDRLPEQSRREIEDYFRDLSDDFGGEVWEAQN